MDPTEEKTEHSALPPDDLKRTLKLAEPDKLPHIGARAEISNRIAEGGLIRLEI